MDGSKSKAGIKLAYIHCYSLPDLPFSSSSSSSSPGRMSAEKRPWWLSNRKVAERYIREAQALIATQDPQDVSFAVGILDAGLEICPRNETAMELKARCLLFLRRFRDVAHMLRDYIPSFKPSSSVSEDDAASSASDSCVSSSSSTSLSRERVKLLGSVGEEGDGEESSLFKCFSVGDLKKRVLAGVCRNVGIEGQWRYFVLGQACCHLGMMEDAMVLLQTFRRLATAAFRRESLDLHDDEFCNSSVPFLHTSASVPPAMLESATTLLNHIKLLLRRKAAAVASLDAGLPTESIRHFSKILDSRRGTPQAFVADCFVGRAAAYRAAGRLVDSIADCNRALALDPTSISALRARAEVLESIRSLPDCLRDLDHLKLLYDAVLRDRKLPGPVWRPHSDVRYGDIGGCLRALTVRIQETRKRFASGEGANSVDYHALIGVNRGCKRSELERAHLLLSLKHRPDKVAAFVDGVEFTDEYRDIDTVRDQARMSGLVLYRMLQKAYNTILSTIIEEENTPVLSASPIPANAAEEEPNNNNNDDDDDDDNDDNKPTTSAVKNKKKKKKSTKVAVSSPSSAVYQGVFCRDIATVSSLLSQVNYGRSIPLKYEALSC